MKKTSTLYKKKKSDGQNKRKSVKNVRLKITKWMGGREDGT